MATVLVTGGTGVVGRCVVRRLRDAGADARVLSRRPGDGVVRGDLATGEGLGDAVDGCDAIVHCATTGVPLYSKARVVDVDGTRRLLAAARDAGSPRIVYISIVGIDRIPLGYYRAKRETEEVVATSGLPYVIQRTTQFHDLILRALEAGAKLPVLPVPKGFRFQPVDADEVAARLVSRLEQEPTGHAEDMGGPKVQAIEDLALSYLVASGRRKKPVVSVFAPGKVARGFREGHNLTPEHAEGTVGWEDFLAQRFGED